MEYKVNIQYKHIKRIYLRVRDGQLYVTAPFYTSKKAITDMINTNMDFVNKNIKREERIKENEPKIGNEITILGKTYSIFETKTRCKLTEHYIFVHEESIKKDIKRLFKDEFYKLMVDKTRYYFDLMGYTCQFPTIKIKDTKSKWGSYNKKTNELNYAIELIFKDDECLDYLVVHELCHITYYNHSKEFHALLKRYIPNYRKIKDRLNGRI